MMGGIKAHYDCIKVFSETEFYEDLKMIDVPVLVMHGEDDQICPFAVTAARSIKLLKNGTLKAYPGFPHGMPTTNADQINAGHPRIRNSISGHGRISRVKALNHEDGRRRHFAVLSAWLFNWVGSFADRMVILGMFSGRWYPNHHLAA